MQKLIKLFCFPFSGGSASVYQQWFKNITSQIELIPVELSGRSRRFNQPLLNNLADNVEDLFQIIQNAIQPSYALFGHSLGCLLIYEFIQKLQHNNFPMPFHIFLSGGIPPHFREIPKQFIHQLSDKELLNELIKIGGISPVFQANQELQNLFLPIIRSDFKMYESYIPSTDKFIFPCDITVMAGDSDHISTPDKVKNWSLYTKNRCKLCVYQGDHFFLQKEASQISHLIETTLLDNYAAPIPFL